MSTEFNFADCFELVADAVPEQTAVVAGDHRLTYAALDERSTRVAHVLADTNAGRSQDVRETSRPVVERGVRDSLFAGHDRGPIGHRVGDTLEAVGEVELHVALDSALWTT